MTPHLFRSAQPTERDFRILHDRGFRTVVSLRNDFDDRPWASAAGLISRQVRMKTRFVEEDDAGKIVLAMHYIRQGVASGQTLVHCRFGSDRTGLMIALWRILYEGWTREDAIAEMERGGTGFHGVFQNIPSFLRRFDAGALRARIG